MDKTAKFHHSVSFWVLTVTLTFLFGILLDSFSGFQRECRALQEDVLRLHILANSDSEEDQAVKLLVRDELLSRTGELFHRAASRDGAEALAETRLTEVERIAEEVLREQGFDYPVRAEVTELFFDTRAYDGFTMPAGRYHALQITLGEGAGRNWWCVLYPPLCVGAASEMEEELSSFTAGERAVLESEPEYEIRFFLVEAAGRIGEWLASLGTGKAE